MKNLESLIFGGFRLLFSLKYHLNINSTGKMTYIIMLMTTSNKKEAESIIKQLLEERLIACANIVDSVSSLFWWKHRIEQENETLVIMKSSEKLFRKLIEKIQELHSYEAPEILALPIVAGSKSYFDWLKNSLEAVE